MHCRTILNTPTTLNPKQPLQPPTSLVAEELGLAAVADRQRLLRHGIVTRFPPPLLLILILILILDNTSHDSTS